MTQKQTYISQSLTAATQLQAIANQLIDFSTPYFPRGYNAGGADPITDADLTAYGITAADFTNLITLTADLDKFLTNQAVSTGDRAAVLAKLRRDI